MSYDYRDLFTAHAAEIEAIRAEAESAAREHAAALERLDELRAASEALRTQIDEVRADLSETLVGDEEQTDELRSEFNQRAQRREQVVAEIAEAHERVERSTPGHTALRRAATSANVSRTAAAKVRDAAHKAIDTAFDERVNKPWRALLDASSQALEDHREREQTGGGGAS